MKKINNYLLKGIAVTFIVYGIFFSWHKIYAKNAIKDSMAVDSAFKQLLLKQENDITNNTYAIKIIELKVDSISKYVEASQKNLDLWLKLLTSIFAILIGYSIFTGLKSRELAKDELTEIRRMRSEITKEADSAKDRLKELLDQIIQIEKTAESAKTIEKEMSIKLDEFSKKEDLVLSEAQLKTIDETITKTKEDLKNSGLESLKILYNAKLLKSYNAKNWEETLRLCNNYLDFEAENEDVLLKRARSYYELHKTIQEDDKFINNSLLDYNEVIRLNPNRYAAFLNRGYLYKTMDKITEAINDYTEAIRLNPEYPLVYKNRSQLYTKIGKAAEAKRDMEVHKSLIAKTLKTT